jgi:hypothetical protein
VKPAGPSDQGVGPYRTQGIGESPLTSAVPAIAHAVAGAVGVRVRDLPMTAAKGYRAIIDARPSSHWAAVPRGRGRADDRGRHAALFRGHRAQQRG